MMRPEGLRPNTHAALVSSTSYLFADYLGTPRAITDQDGTVVDCSDYSPFGRLLETPTRTLPCQQTPNHAAQQFTGKERDQVTGLDWFTSSLLQRRHKDGSPAPMHW
jgi:hypothetical protein